MTTDPGRGSRPVGQLLASAGSLLRSATRPLISLLAGSRDGADTGRMPVVPAAVILYVQPQADARRARRGRAR